MTEKLYDVDSHQKEFDAEVISCKKFDDHFETILDKTLFFPEGGGQRSDTGTIDDVEIFDVYIKDGEIRHYSHFEITSKKMVHGKIDYEKRFRRMQNHSGEHIVSGLVNSIYGFNNVGFHMGSEDVTIDYDGVLSYSDILKIEQLANKAVSENVSITAVYPDKEELQNIKYRSKLDLTENVRIVTIEGYDICACCAPHVCKTGEIGIVKLLDHVNYKGGVRIHMLCGFDALDDYNDKYRNVKLIAEALSAKQTEAFDAFKKYQNEITQYKSTIYFLKKELLEYKKAAIKESSENICIIENGYSINDLRELSAFGAEKCAKICIALSGDDNNGYIFAASSVSLSMKKCSAEFTKALCGKGGGSDKMVQGTLLAKKEEIEEFFRTY